MIQSLFFTKRNVLKQAKFQNTVYVSSDLGERWIFRVRSDGSTEINKIIGF